MPMLLSIWEDLKLHSKQLYTAISEEPIMRRIWSVIIYIIMFIVALTAIGLILVYVLYTLSFVGIPYLQFMHFHKPYSFIVLILLWASSLFRYSFETESPLSVRWELFFYFLSFLVVCSGIGDFLVLPYLLWSKQINILKITQLSSWSIDFILFSFLYFVDLSWLVLRLSSNSSSFTSSGRKEGTYNWRESSRDCRILHQCTISQLQNPIQFSEDSDQLDSLSKESKVPVGAARSPSSIWMGRFTYIYFIPKWGCSSMYILLELINFQKCSTGESPVLWCI